MSCSNSSELMFMGKNLSTPCEEFEKHLESKGFKHDGEHSFKGKYLGEDVSIVLSEEKDGHFTKLELMDVSDAETCKKLFEKACKEIGKEHDGFKEKDKEKKDKLSYAQQSTGKYISVPTNYMSKEYYNEAGKKISISCNDASLMAIFLVIYEMKDKN
jgi:hypothetical protein